jgi:poly-beta-1,6-N-acetyl-D-glucosamine synthase
MSAESLFVVSVALLAYTYLGYPALMFVYARLGARPAHAAAVEPTLSVVIVAYNEVARIARRIENLLSVDYPADRLEILLGSDGSSDGTAAAARAYEHAGVRVIAFETRRGKAAVLNDLVPKAAGEIVVLADVRQQFAAGALRALVAPFADPGVGAVSGELILTQDADGTAVGEGIGVYWRYEKFIRRHEARVDSTVGATGAIYALRRELFEPIADDTILDDVLIPARIARRGYRVLFEPEARAYDRAAATAEEEFTRKVRTIAGKFQLLAREAWLLSPFHSRLWMQTVSHHALRLLTPLLLVTAAGANLFLLERPLYQWTLAGQVVFYAAAVGGQRLRRAGCRIPFVGVPYVISLLAWATVVAFLKFVRGRQRVTWEKASA